MKTTRKRLDLNEILAGQEFLAPFNIGMAFPTKDLFRVCSEDASGYANSLEVLKLEEKREGDADGVVAVCVRNLGSASAGREFSTPAQAESTRLTDLVSSPGRDDAIRFYSGKRSHSFSKSVNAAVA